MSDIDSERKKYNPERETGELTRLVKNNQFVISYGVIFGTQGEALTYYGVVNKLTPERDVVYSIIDYGLVGGDSLLVIELGDRNAVNLP